MPQRESPEIPANYPPIPKKVLQEIRKLIQHDDVFVWTSFGGIGMGQTKNRDIAQRLIEGWEIAKDDEQRPVMLRFPSGGEFVKAKGGPTYYEFRVPSVLIWMVRALHDERAAA